MDIGWLTGTLADLIRIFIGPLVLAAVAMVVIWLVRGRPSMTLRARLTLETVDSLAHVIDRVEDAIQDLDIVVIDRRSESEWRITTTPNDWGACEVVRIRAVPLDEDRVRILMSSKRRWFAGIFDDGENERNLEVLRVALCRDDRRPLRHRAAWERDPARPAARPPWRSAVDRVARSRWWVLAAWLVVIPGLAVRDIVRTYDTDSVGAWLRIVVAVLFQSFFVALLVAAMAEKRRRRRSDPLVPSEP